jgi:hypothetical protein
MLLLLLLLAVCRVQAAGVHEPQGVVGICKCAAIWATYTVRVAQGDTYHDAADID